MLSITGACCYVTCCSWNCISKMCYAYQLNTSSFSSVTSSAVINPDYCGESVQMELQSRGENKQFLLETR